MAVCPSCNILCEKVVIYFVGTIIYVLLLNGFLLFYWNINPLFKIYSFPFFNNYF